MEKSKLEKVQLENSNEVIWVHTKDKCKGQTCCIHNRTNHSMRSFPQHWREDRKVMERICPCGCGHIDPDDPTEDRIHGCCGKHCETLKGK